jgi:hypothetical protein
MKLDDEQRARLAYESDWAAKGGAELSFEELPEFIKDAYSRVGAYRSFLIELKETRALLASLDEERLEEIITDSIDLDWTPRTAARAIVRAMKGGDT